MPASRVVGRAARVLIDRLGKILSISSEQTEEIAMRQHLRDNSGNLLGWRQQVGPRINGYTAAGTDIYGVRSRNGAQQMGAVYFLPKGVVFMFH